MVFNLIDTLKFNYHFVYEVVKSVSLWELVLLMTDIGFQLLKRIKLIINHFGPINPIKMKLKNVCIKLVFLFEYKVPNQFPKDSNKETH